MLQNPTVVTIPPDAARAVFLILLVLSLFRVTDYRWGIWGSQVQ